jgi:DNA (cytosine-5)-methyltransferase 1
MPCRASVKGMARPNSLRTARSFAVRDGILSRRTLSKIRVDRSEVLHRPGLGEGVRPSSQLIGVDLFSGAGGMSLGATWAGVSVKIAIDKDPHATSTYKTNHPGVDTRTFDLSALKRLAIKRAKNECLILFGGPPCRGFSTSNQRTRSLRNPTNWLFSEFLRHTRQLQPDWVVFENVKGLLETEGGFFFDQVVSKLKRQGYTVSDWLLNAEDFGVPQKRWRVFIVGSLHGISPTMPARQASKPVTVADAILDLPILRNGASVNRMPYRSEPHSMYANQMRMGLEDSSNHFVTRNDPRILERYRHIPRGGNWKDIPRRLMRNYAALERCHTGIYMRLKLNAPSVVIGNFRKNMLIHPTQTRGLSVREAARLQSFPDDFQFLGSIGLQQQQVGNAVPPLLAKAVFDSITKAN